MLNYIWIRNLIDVVRFSNLLKFHIGKKPRNPMFGIFFMRQRFPRHFSAGEVNERKLTGSPFDSHRSTRWPAGHWIQWFDSESRWLPRKSSINLAWCGFQTFCWSINWWWAAFDQDLCLNSLSSPPHDGSVAKLVAKCVAWSGQNQNAKRRTCGWPGWPSAGF